MRLAPAGALIALALLLAGCGGGGSRAGGRRAAVNAYFTRVDHAEQGLLAVTGQIDQTFRAYSLSTVSAAELHGLATAQSTIGAALRRLKTLSPPPDARKINANLLALTALQYRVAHELAWTARYVPRSTQALVPLGPAGRKLGAAISAAGTAPLKNAPSPTGSGGGAVWARAGCASCHTLAAAGASGTAGPSLDLLHPSSAAVAAQVRSGGPGMPAYAKTLAAAQVAALASYVASSEQVPPTTAAVLARFASAFSAYGASLHGVLGAVGRLDAPPIMHPAWLAERSILSRSVALCSTIAADLDRQDVRTANAAIRTLFITVASGTSAGSEHAAAIHAIRAYDGELTTISKLAAAIAHERARLVAQIG